MIYFKVVFYKKNTASQKRISKRSLKTKLDAFIFIKAIMYDLFQGGCGDNAFAQSSQWKLSRGWMDGFTRD